MQRGTGRVPMRRKRIDNEKHSTQVRGEDARQTMSVKVSALVWEVPLRATEKIVLLKLADNANHAGRNAFPSVSTIAARCGLSERAVQAALRRLQSQGLIAVQARATRYRPTTYSIVMGAGQSPMAGTGASDPSRGACNGTAAVQQERIMGAGPSPDPSIDPSIEPSLRAISQKREPTALEACRPEQDCQGSRRDPIENRDERLTVVLSHGGWWRVGQLAEITGDPKTSIRASLKERFARGELDKFEEGNCSYYRTKRPKPREALRSKCESLLTLVGMKALERRFLN